MQRLIILVFLLIAACGGSATDHPVAEGIDNHTEQPEKDPCYVMTQNRIEDFLDAMRVTRRWHTDPDVYISDNMPQDINDAIYHVVDKINQNMDSIKLTITEDQDYATIVFSYSNIGTSYHGTARTPFDSSNEITYSEITINSNPQARGNYTDGRFWDCDKARQALVAHELFHALGFHHPIHFNGTTVMSGLPSCTSYDVLPWRGQTVPNRLELDALRFFYNDQMGHCN